RAACHYCRKSCPPGSWYRSSRTDRRWYQSQWCQKGAKGGKRCKNLHQGQINEKPELPRVFLMTKSGVLADGEDAVGGGGGAGQAVVGTGFERGPRVPRARRRGARKRAGALRDAIDAAGGGQAALHTARWADDAQRHGDAA